VIYMSQYVTQYATDVLAQAPKTALTVARTQREAQMASVYASLVIQGKTARYMTTIRIFAIQYVKFNLVAAIIQFEDVQYVLLMRIKIDMALVSVGLGGQATPVRVIMAPVLIIARHVTRLSHVRLVWTIQLLMSMELVHV
jgi:hypothetical protein